MRSVKRRAVVGAFAVGMVIGVAFASVVAWKVRGAVEARFALDAALQEALLEVFETAEALALLDGGEVDETRAALTKRLALQAVTAESLTADGARTTGRIRPLLPYLDRLERQLGYDKWETLAVEKLRQVAASQAANAV